MCIYIYIVQVRMCLLFNLYINISVMLNKDVPLFNYFRNTMHWGGGGGGGVRGLGGGGGMTKLPWPSNSKSYHPQPIMQNVWSFCNSCIWVPQSEKLDLKISNIQTFACILNTFMYIYIYIYIHKWTFALTVPIW